VDGQKGRGREREGGQRENIERIHTKRKEWTQGSLRERSGEKNIKSRETVSSSELGFEAETDP
jgi:hypothetical protein